MPFTINEEKTFDQPLSVVTQATLAAIKGLEGKIVSETDGEIKVLFDKKILGKVLGDRTKLELQLKSGTADQTQMEIMIYPLDAIGQKLKFGARKGVSKTVLSWFYAHLKHHLGA